MAANVAMKTHKCGYENTIVISLRGRLPRAEERDPRTPLVGADPSKRQLWSLQVRQTVPTRRVGWVFSNEDSNLRMSLWGVVPQSQYGALLGITHLIPPLGSFTSPWNRGIRWM